MAVQEKERKTGSNGSVLEANPTVKGMKHDLRRGGRVRTWGRGGEG